MSKRLDTYTCQNCDKVFESRNLNPQYCSRICRNQSPDFKQRMSDKLRQIPDRPCVICGKIFRPPQRNANNGTPIECCSFACSRLKARKHQREDITHCLVCGKALTKRQISNQNQLCSRACHGKRFEQWHEKPENKAFMRDHGARCAIRGQRKPTKIEEAMMTALDSAGVAYEYQYPIGNSYGLIFACDFAFPQSKLIVETDGDYWHSLPKMIKRDKHKDAYLHAAGYTVLRFTETQINQDANACVHLILCHLSGGK